MSKEIIDSIINSDGSVQTITEIPIEIRNRYKTAFEISQRVLNNQIGIALQQRFDYLNSDDE